MLEIENREWGILFKGWLIVRIKNKENLLILEDYWYLLKIDKKVICNYFGQISRHSSAQY